MAWPILNYALLFTNPRTYPKSLSSHTLFLESLRSMEKSLTHQHLPEIESTVNEEMSDFKLKRHMHIICVKRTLAARLSRPRSLHYLHPLHAFARDAAALADKRRASLSLNQEICWPSGGRDQHWQHTTIMAQGHRL
jgi:hypothetical protein